MLMRVVVALASALLGAVLLGLAAALVWVLAFEQIPEGGTGNARIGDVVFAWGMLAGAVLGAGAGAWFTRPRQDSRERTSRLAGPAVVAAVLSVLVPIGVVLAAGSVLLSALAVRRGERHGRLALLVGVIATAYCFVLPPLFWLPR